MKSRRLLKFMLTLLREFLILIVLGNGLSLLNLKPEFWTWHIFLSNCLLSVMIGYPTWKGIGFIMGILDRKFPWLENPLKRLVYQLVFMILFGVVLMGTGMFLWMALSGNLSFSSINMMAFKSLKVGLIFLMLSLLAGSAVLFFKNWRNAAIQQEELKRAHLSLQYQTLVNQVKPHFLFNSLSSLVTLIHTDTDKATEFVHTLSRVYRYLLEQRESELVSLSEELAFTEDYAFLQKIRFGDNLRMVISEKLDLKRMVLPLSMQMIVENAIKHNEISAGHPLTIEISQGEEHEIVIKNSLKRKEIHEPSLGLGIENLQKRISFFSGKSILVEESQDFFTVKIPTMQL